MECSPELACLVFLGAITAIVLVVYCIYKVLCMYELYCTLRKFVGNFDQYSVTKLMDIITDLRTKTDYRSFHSRVDFLQNQIEELKKGKKK